MMSWLESLELLVLFLSAAILMWDNAAVMKGRQMEAKVRLRRDPRGRS